ncbi:MAG: FHA domain-containing protein [Phototrophicaceae bacterium]
MATIKTLLKCRNCGHALKSTAVICPECGEPARKQDMRASETMMVKDNLLVDKDDAPAYASGTSRLNGSLVYITIERQNEAITRNIRERPVLLGRLEQHEIDRYNIDLSHLSALERGVSRHHVALISKEGRVYVRDLGSANGTTLNGTELEANKLYPVHDGDELMLGRMLLWINFE